ncbi:MAG: PilZ domain-containing protein [Sphingomonas bacterium]|nr:PilZ domain-containing protein [Sphingomonas bacterium]
MDESGTTQNRRARRSHVLMAASIEVDGIAVAVKLRNLSPEGALVEAAQLPTVGTSVVFRKKELNLAGRVAWVTAGRAGIAFDTLLDPGAVLRHVPRTKPQPKLDFRRPGIRSGDLSAGERQIAHDWIWGDPIQNRRD